MTCTYVNYTMCSSVILAILFILESEVSPVRGEEVLCRRGWLHYRKFCVTRGVEGQEELNAVYCDGLGGIGVGGICVTKANVGQQEHDLLLPTEDSLLGSEPYLSSDTGKKDTGSELDPTPEAFSSSITNTSLWRILATLRHKLKSESNNGCPEGWEHYRDMCVYKPTSVEETCHTLRAVEFRGLCLRHADLSGLESSKKQYYKEDKRVCCCAHPNGMPNNFGC